MERALVAALSKRLGAEVTILYRRTRAEMPAIEREIEEALEEGIRMEYLAAPAEVLRNADGSDVTPTKVGADVYTAARELGLE